MSTVVDVARANGGSPSPVMIPPPLQMGMVTRLPSGLDPGYLPVFHSSPSTSNTDSVSIGSIATVTTAATRAEVIDTGDVEDRGGGGEGHEESSRCQQRHRSAMMAHHSINTADTNTMQTDSDPLTVPVNTTAHQAAAASKHSKLPSAAKAVLTTDQMRDQLRGMVRVVEAYTQSENTGHLVQMYTVMKDCVKRLQEVYSGARHLKQASRETARASKKRLRDMLGDADPVVEGAMDDRGPFVNGAGNTCKHSQACEAIDTEQSSDAKRSRRASWHE